MNLEEKQEESAEVVEETAVTEEVSAEEVTNNCIQICEVYLIKYADRMK